MLVALSGEGERVIGGTHRVLASRGSGWPSFGHADVGTGWDLFADLYGMGEIRAITGICGGSFQLGGARIAEVGGILFGEARDSRR